MTQKRYVTTIEMYIFAEDDNEAVEHSNDIAKAIDEYTGGDCKVIGIVEQKFGTIGNRKVL